MSSGHCVQMVAKCYRGYASTPYNLFWWQSSASGSCPLWLSKQLYLMSSTIACYLNPLTEVDIPGTWQQDRSCSACLWLSHQWCLLLSVICQIATIAIFSRLSAMTLDQVYVLSVGMCLWLSLQYRLMKVWKTLQNRRKTNAKILSRNFLLMAWGEAGNGWSWIKWSDVAVIFLQFSWHVINWKQAGC